jgi:hypothetical protein
MTPRSSCVWDVILDLGNEKVKRRYHSNKVKNHCHAMIREVRKRRKGDKFYLNTNGKIVRHRIDIVGTWKIKRTPPLEEN